MIERWWWVGGGGEDVGRTCYRRQPGRDVFVVDEVSDQHEAGAAEGICWLREAGGVSQCRYRVSNLSVPKETSSSLVLFPTTNDRERETHHSHQLRHCCPGQSQLVDHRGKHSAHSPASNSVTDPEQGESVERRILEQSSSLLPIPSLSGRRRLRSWEVGDDGLLLVVREEIARVWVVGEVEEGVDAAEDGGDAFAGRRWDRTLVFGKGTFGIGD